MNKFCLNQEFVLAREKRPANQIPCKFHYEKGLFYVAGFRH